jgi:transcriptional repressor NrdR
MEVVPLMVVKRAGQREPFDRLKIVHGLTAASKGRPIEVDTFDALVDEIEEQARSFGSEVSSEWIGRAVLDRLRLIDQVACLRFASVYKDFTGIDDFAREVSLIKLDEH